MLEQILKVMAQMPGKHPSIRVDLEGQYVRVRLSAHFGERVGSVERSFHCDAIEQSAFDLTNVLLEDIRRFRETVTA